MPHSPSLRILHLTDTHLFGDGSKHYGTVDTTDHLRRALAFVESQPFDLVVCSGDVSEDGTVSSYELARDLVVPWAEERGARAVFAMGNHDRRAEFRAVFGDVFSVSSRDGWRTVVLDTSVPGAGYGSLGVEQLDALRGVLADPAEHGTVLVMHHPPVDAQTDLLQALALDAGDAALLWEVLRGSDVRVILSGHYHLPIVETVAGIPVVVAPGVANLARAFASRAEESAGDGFGGAVVEVTPRGVRVLPFMQPVSGAEVFRFSGEVVQQIIGAAGRFSPHVPSAQTEHPEASRKRVN